jgi:hypothetical protein
MQLCKLLKEKCFRCNLQCLDLKKTAIYEEQYIVDLLKSFGNVDEDGLRRFLDFLSHLLLLRHEICGIDEQLSSLATYFHKLERSILMRKKSHHHERRPEGESKHCQNRQNLKSHLRKKGKLKNNLIMNRKSFSNYTFMSFCLGCICVRGLYRCLNLNHFIISVNTTQLCNFCINCTGLYLSILLDSILRTLNLTWSLVSHFVEFVSILTDSVSKSFLDDVLSFKLSTFLFAFKVLQLDLRYYVTSRRIENQAADTDGSVVNLDLYLLEYDSDRDGGGREKGGDLIYFNNNNP